MRLQYEDEEFVRLMTCKSCTSATAEDSIHSKCFDSSIVQQVIFQLLRLGSQGPRKSIYSRKVMADWYWPSFPPILIDRDCTLDCGPTQESKYIHNLHCRRTPDITSLPKTCMRVFASLIWYGESDNVWASLYDTDFPKASTGYGI